MQNRRIVITRRGGPEVLSLVQAEAPVPSAGEVRVRVEAAGVAFADLMMREGLYPGAPPFPFTPGYDLVGKVESSGAEAGGFAPGERVAALTVRGAYADYVCLPAEDLVKVPEGVDPSEGVCLVLNYLTAWQMLHRVAGVQKGDRIVVHGAAGGVGTALLELGGLAGLEMLGTASAGKLALVRELGATAVDYAREDFVESARKLWGCNRADAVFDPIGGSYWKRSYSVLGFGGTLVAYGYYGGTRQGRRSLAGSLKAFLADPGFSALKMIGKSTQVAGYSVSTLKRRRPAWHREDLGALFDLLAGGKLHPVIGEKLPLEQAARAHELLGQRAVRGKIVLLTGA